MAEFTLEALKDEIVNDPESLGYKTAPLDWKSDQEIADLINDPANGAIVRRQSVRVSDIKAVILEAHFNGLSPGESDYLMFVLDAESIDPRPNPIHDGILGVWSGGASVTKNAIQALMEKQGSRAEVLWGEGRTISLRDVGGAQNLV